MAVEMLKYERDRGKVDNRRIANVLPKLSAYRKLSSLLQALQTGVYRLQILSFKYFHPARNFLVSKLFESSYKSGQSVI